VCYFSCLKKKDKGIFSCVFFANKEMTYFLIFFYQRTSFSLRRNMTRPTSLILQEISISFAFFYRTFLTASRQYADILLTSFWRESSEKNISNLIFLHFLDYYNIVAIKFILALNFFNLKSLYIDNFMLI